MLARFNGGFESLLSRLLAECLRTSGFPILAMSDLFTVFLLCGAPF